MFEQFLKSGDYAMGGPPSMKRRRMMQQENPEDDFDDEDLAFKELIEGEAGKRPHTEGTNKEAQF